MTRLEKCRKFQREHGNGDIFYRILWWCHLPATPAVFMPFAVNVLLNSARVMLFFFAININTLMFKSVAQMVPPLTLSLAISICGGIVVAIGQKIDARKLNLPKWRDYGSD